MEYRFNAERHFLKGFSLEDRTSTLLKKLGLDFFLAAAVAGIKIPKDTPSTITKKANRTIEVIRPVFIITTILKHSANYKL